MNALRTLVVEDDAMIAGLLAETLEGLGHGVCAVETNVARAVPAASRWRPDLMIVDVGLGEASGIAAVKEILCPVCLRDGQRIERFVAGARYGPPPKALPRVGPGSSNSEGAFSGVGLRPRR